MAVQPSSGSTTAAPAARSDDASDPVTAMPSQSEVSKMCMGYESAAQRSRYAHEGQDQERTA